MESQLAGTQSNPVAPLTQRFDIREILGAAHCSFVRRQSIASQEVDGNAAIASRLTLRPGGHPVPDRLNDLRVDQPLEEACRVGLPIVVIRPHAGYLVA